MAMWKANKQGFVSNKLIQPGEVFEGPDGMDFKWADPVDGDRPIEVKKSAPASDTFAGIQAGPKVADLSAKLDAANARVADLEAQLIAASNAAPIVADESDTVKSLKADLKAAQKRIVALEADTKTKDDLLAAKDQEYQEMMKNRDDWKQAYDDLVAEHTPDAPEEPG